MSVTKYTKKQFDLIFSDDDLCLDYLFKVQYQNIEQCPNCKSTYNKPIEDDLDEVRCLIVHKVNNFLNKENMEIDDNMNSVHEGLKENKSFNSNSSKHDKSKIFDIINYNSFTVIKTNNANFSTEKKSSLRKNRRNSMMKVSCISLRQYMTTMLRARFSLGHKSFLLL